MFSTILLIIVMNEVSMHLLFFPMLVQILQAATLSRV